MPAENCREVTLDLAVRGVFCMNCRIESGPVTTKSCELFSAKHKGHRLIWTTEVTSAGELYGRTIEMEMEGVQ